MKKQIMLGGLLLLLGSCTPQNKANDPMLPRYFPVCLLNDRHRPLVETKIWSLDNLME